MDLPLLFGAGFLAAAISGAAGFGGALLLLPVLVHTLGAQVAVPVLTLAQLAGNLSRAGFGLREISWRPVAWFLAGAVPASLLGAYSFIALPEGFSARLVGAAVILLVLADRRGRRIWRGRALLALGGGLVGFLSGVAGSAGPLGAAIFLSLGLPPVAYGASEAVTAVAIHLVKSLVYQRYLDIGWEALRWGALLGIAMIAGSWAGKKAIERLPRERFMVVVRWLLVVLGAQLLLWG